jgi:hypothetical protein
VLIFIFAISNAFGEPLDSSFGEGLIVGARPLSMGGAFAGVSDDIKAMRSNLYGLGIYHTLFGVCYRFEHIGVVGIGWNSIDYTDAIGFDDRENVLRLSWAQGTNFFQFGSDIKYLYSNFESSDINGSAHGYGLDLGILLNFSDRRFNIGIVLKNAVSEILYNTGTRERFNKELTAGISIRPQDRLLVSFDVKGIGKLNRCLAGVESYITENFVLRMGGDSKKNISAGIGFRIDRWEIDYAYNINSMKIGNTHYLAIVFSLK